MTTDTILHKYMRHLRYIDQGNIVHLDAVELALRCALDDLADWLGSATDHATTDENLIAAQGRRITELQADLERLQTATDTNNAALTDQIAQLNADNAALIRRNKELTDALHISTNGTGLAIKNPPFVDSVPSAISNQQSPINNSMWTDLYNNALDFLDDEAKDWWIGCDSGRHTWRTVPKPVQLRIVRHILSFGPESGAMKMTDFDAIKPDWMPGAGSHTKTLNLSWQQLNDWRVEL